MPESLNGPIETDDNLIIQLFANDQSNNISFVGSVINPLARAAIAVSDLLKGNRSKLSNIRVGRCLNAIKFLPSSFLSNNSLPTTPILASFWCSL